MTLGGLIAAFRRHYPGCEWRELPVGEFLILVEEMATYWEEMAQV